MAKFPVGIPVNIGKVARRSASDYDAFPLAKGVHRVIGIFNDR